MYFDRRKRHIPIKY